MLKVQSGFIASINKENFESSTLKINRILKSVLDNSQRTFVMKF